MGKILYKNNALVAFRNKSLPMRYKVIRYHKGSMKPYELQSVKYPDNGTVRAHVSEIISWGNHPYNKGRRDDDVEVRKAQSTATPSNGLSQDEVAKIVREEIASAMLQNNMEMQEVVQQLHDHVAEDAAIIARSVLEQSKNEVDEDA